EGSTITAAGSNPSMLVADQSGIALSNSEVLVSSPAGALLYQDGVLSMSSSRLENATGPAIDAIGTATVDLDNSVVSGIGLFVARDAGIGAAQLQMTAVNDSVLTGDAVVAADGSTANMLM